MPSHPHPPTVDRRLTTSSARLLDAAAMPLAHGSPELERITRIWWLIALRGALAVLFGIGALLLPHIAVAVLVLCFGVYALVDGLFTVITALRFFRLSDHWPLLLLEGGAGIVVGSLTLAWPAVAALAFAAVLAIWAITTGGLAIVAAVRLREHIASAWLWMLAGIASVMLGVLVALYPLAGLIAWALMLAIAMLVAGVALLALAVRLRQLLHHNRTP